MKIKINYINKIKLKKFALKIGFTLSTALVINNYASIIKNCHYDYSTADNYRVDNDDILSQINYSDNILEDNNQFECVNLYSSNFVTDLSCFSPVYSKIRKISIINCSSVVDLSPLYYMNNLEEVYIKECPGVNQELVNYLDSHNIIHNITKEDIENSEKINIILKSIINDDMTDSEKIKKISLYVENNYSYDMDYMDESNKFPLSCMLKHGKGVCSSYAYLSNVLFRKANINSFELIGASHAWNAVEIDNKYYYVDVTSINSNTIFDNWAIEYFNLNDDYMSNPGENNSTGMVNYNESKEKIIIADSLIELIDKGEQRKHFFEKYKTEIYSYARDSIFIYLVLDLVDKGFSAIARKSLKAPKHCSKSKCKKKDITYI